MKVLLAGASGAIGMPLIRRLRAAGHDVLALHRSPEGRARLAAAGTTPIRVDVLSTPALVRALQGQRADAVICEITALKKTPMSHKDMTATNILRTKGTANLIAAAHQLGARRFLTQSMVFGYGYGDWGGRVLTEADQFGPPGYGRFEEHLAAMRSNEEQVLRADGLDGIAMRYGLVYGPGPASDTLIEGLRRRKLPIVRNSGVLPWVYVDDAAAATVAALEQATPGTAYNITDDEPVSLATLMIVMARAIGAPRPRAVPGWLLATAPIARAAVTGGLRVSSTRAKTELGWTLQAPTYREGISLLARHYAQAAA
jgi:nucleoside-diphosphate-sugar epimerase